MLQYLIVCPLVFLAGFVDSIAGGGGLISLPAYLISGVPAHMALGTNKMSSSVGTAIAALRLLRRGYLRGMALTTAAAAAAALAGSSLGARLALRVPDTIIRHMMIVALPVVAYYVLRSKKMGEERKHALPQGRQTAIAAAAGLGIGAYDGFYGPGTGTFLILVLTGMAGMELRTAAAETKVINLSSNVAALITFIVVGNVYYPLGLAAALCSVAGNYLGAGLVVNNGRRIVRPVVLLVLTILFVKILSGT